MVTVTHVQGFIMDGIDDGTGLRQTHSVADTVLATNPTGVDEPDLGMVNKHKITKAVGPKAADYASRWSYMFCLAVLALLANFLILVINFLWKLKG